MKALLYVAVFFSTMAAHPLISLSTPIGGLAPFRFIIIMTALVILVRGIFNNNGRILISKTYNRYSVQFMFVWLIYALLSVFWAVDLHDWFRNIFFLSIGVVSVVIFVNVFNDRENIIEAFYALQYGIIIQQLAGWHDVITRQYYFLAMSGKSEKLVGRSYEILVHGPLRFPMGMTCDPNDFATLMFIGVFVSWALYKLGTGKFRYLYFLAMIDEAILLVMTSSRANILGLGLAIISVLFVDSGVGSKVKYAILIATALIIVSLSGAMLFIEEQLTFNFSGVGKVGSDVVRTNLIKNGLEFLIQTCGFGVGAGQVESWMKTDKIYEVLRITNMHNWWAELLTNYGIFITALYLLFYCRMFLDFYKAIRHKYLNRRDKVICLSLCAIMAGYVLASISSSSVISTECIWVFWSLCITYQAILGQNIRKSSRL